jgi:hypothetical protein
MAFELRNPEVALNWESKSLSALDAERAPYAKAPACGGGRLGALVVDGIFGK